MTDDYLLQQLAAMQQAHHDSGDAVTLQKLNAKYTPRDYTKPHSTVFGEITKERFAALTRHLKVNGQPLESMLLKLQEEKNNAKL